MSSLSATVATFPVAAARLRGQPSPHVLFSSTWCPDCTRAQPAVLAAAAAAGVTLLVVDVGERADWKNTAQPHPLKGGAVRLRCIPTLLAWDVEAAAPGARLDKELEVASDEKAVTALCAALFARK